MVGIFFLCTKVVAIGVSKVLVVAIGTVPVKSEYACTCTVKRVLLGLRADNLPKARCLALATRPSIELSN